MNEQRYDATMRCERRNRHPWYHHSGPFAVLAATPDPTQPTRPRNRGHSIVRAHVVGHSSGAAVAAQFALHDPERVPTLLLLELSLF